MAAISETKQYQQLWDAKRENRLAHAIMLSGVKGTNKNSLIDCFSRALVCDKTSANGVPCDKCHACRLALGRVHPDILWVEPEKAGSAIKVEQIRIANEFLQQTSFSGLPRMIIISPADAMNVSAANALLKTLEEPSLGAYLFLVNDQTSRLPATIMSRCQRIVFQQPSKEQQFTKLVEDPEREKIFRVLVGALDINVDRIKLVAEFAKSESLTILDHILSFLMDLLKVQLDVPVSEVQNRDFIDSYTKLKTSTSLNSNLDLLLYVRKMRAAASLGVNFNKQLLLESIIFRWGRA